MAGDWMKICKDTPDKPEVLIIATKLNIHPDIAFARCFRLWSWFDSNTTNGVTNGVTKVTLDALLNRDGLCDAMIDVCWLGQDAEGCLFLPNFDYHNSETAKTRAMSAKRQDKFRKNGNNSNAESNAESNGTSVTKVTGDALLEKRREEKKETITQDKPARKKTTPHPLPDDFAPNETSISLAKSLGISWQAEIPKFRDHHSQKGTVGRDWQAGFRTWLNNAVKFGTATKATIGDSSVGLPSDIIKLPDGRVMTRAGLDLIRSFG